MSMFQTEGKVQVTLRSGERKWMTRREYRAYLKRLEALKSIYQQYVKYNIVDTNLPDVDQIRSIVEMGNDLMNSICEIADSITVAGYNRVKNEVSQKITKGEFTDIVRYVSRHLDKDKSIDDEKFTARLLKDIDATIYKINLKRSFYTNFNEFKDFVVPEDSTNVIFPKLDAKNNKRFKEIVKSCAKARNYLDTQLWPTFHEYSDVAEYISKGDLNYDKYKQLVDYMHYENNDDKRFQNQKKRYKLLIENFVKSYLLCKKYGYEYFTDVEALIYNQTCDKYLDEASEQLKQMA